MLKKIFVALIEITAQLLMKNSTSKKVPEPVKKDPAPYLDLNPIAIPEGVKEEVKTITPETLVEEKEESMKKPIITVEQFKSVFPKADVKLVDSFVKILPPKGIDTLNRVASFIAQCGHESGDFKFYIENLNYSDTALMSVFKSRFPTKQLALEYARKPEKIANFVYSNRMGNGAPESGDGWTYRGRGFIQLTGKTNYTAFAKYIGKPVQDTIKYCETLDGAVESAVWFWVTNDCNKFADADDIKLQTRRINGGFNGLEHREKLYIALKNALKGNFSR